MRYKRVAVVDSKKRALGIKKLLKRLYGINPKVVYNKSFEDYEVRIYIPRLTRKKLRKLRGQKII